MKKIFFMLHKIFRDLFVDQMSPLGDWSGEKLESYYFRFILDRKKVNALIADFDENGVPLNTTYIDVEEKKLHYYPISIGQYGLAVFHSYLDTKSEDKKVLFLNIADWFVKNQVEDDVLGVYWLTDVPKPEYDIYTPWKSAFTQSRAISILLRAWQITKDDHFLELCKKALIPFKFDISQGGVSYYHKDNLPFFEEYVAKDPTLVLAGHPFVLFGIYDFIRAYNEEDQHRKLAKLLFDQGLKSLLEWMPTFDMGWWVKYKHYKLDDSAAALDPCTIGYMRLLIAELQVLGKITNNKEIEKYALKFQSYITPKSIFKMYILKFHSLKKINRL